MLKYAIIGGSDAGISAALRIKELDRNAQVQLFLKDEYPNYSICGIPFYLSGEITDWKTLAHRTREAILNSGIQVVSSQNIRNIQLTDKTLFSETAAFPYDKLLIATGAGSAIPDIKGHDLQGVFTLRWIDDMLGMEAYLLKNHINDAVIIGGGYIGLEMADALVTRGLKVTLLDPSPVVLKTLDEEFGQLVQTEMSNKGVRVITATRIREIQKTGRRLLLIAEDGTQIETGIVLLATGAKPNALLLTEQGIAKGSFGAYQVNEQMQTNLADVYAAGDCTETWHHLLREYQYMPLGTTAHKQGRIAGENMAGGNKAYAGTLGTQVVKMFDLVAGRTGLHDRDCQKYKLNHKTIQSVHYDHKQYYPIAQPLTIRITGDPLTGKLLGMQIVGPYKTEVSKRIDIAAAAIYHDMTIEQLNDLDLSYTPPLSSPWDPVQMAAQEWMRQNKN